MKCQRCSSVRVAHVTGKCSDCSGVSLQDHETEGYVPRDMGIGGGDYMRFDLCLDCGQMQGTWPLPQTELESPPDT